MHTVCKVMSFCIVQYSVMWCNVYNVLYFSLTSIWEHKFVGGLIKNRTHPWSRRWDVGMCWLLTYMDVRGFPSLWPCLCLRVENRTSVLHVFIMGLTGWGGVGWGGMITFICTSSHIWCYAAVIRLALPHIYDATLLYVVLHFLTYLMLRCCYSSCTDCQDHLAQKKWERRWGFWHFHSKVRAYFLRNLHFQGNAKPLWFVVKNQWRRLQTLKTWVR